MKRLIASLALALGMVFSLVSPVAAIEEWRLDMFEPTASTVNRTINIEYKVLSIREDDSFEVKLFQNDVLLGTQNAASEAGGNSGIFNVNIPSTGTYTYKIEAKNSFDDSIQSESKAVQVVDGPAPTVTTVFVNNAAAGGAGAQAGAAGAAANAAGAAAGGAGQVAGAAANEGQVSAEGAASDEQNQGDVLGTSDQNNKNNRRRNTAIGVVAVLAIAGGAYYWFLARPRNSA